MQALPFKMIRGFAAAGVDGIPEQRVSNVCHMDADLMGAAGFQTAFDIGLAVKALQYMDMGDGGFAEPGWNDGHFFAVIAIAADVTADGKVVLR